MRFSRRSSILLCLVVGALATAALRPGTVGAGVSVGHSGWEWSNPLPQGNALRALAFSGERGYAAGSFGTLMRSDDAGTSWAGLSTGLTDDLTELLLIDPDTIVVAGGCAVRRSTDGGETFASVRWTRHESSCPSPITSVAFPDPTVEYVLLEDGSLYRSGDGGSTWNAMTPVPFAASGSAQAGAEINFTSPDTGIAAASDGLYRTTDGGLSWNRVATHLGGIEALSFPTPMLGYAAGGGGAVLKTTDGGISWKATAATSFTQAPLSALVCRDAVSCLAASRDGAIVRTRDGGLTWTVASLPRERALAVALATGPRALAAGAGGAISVSDDGGATWSARDSALIGGFTRLRGDSGFLAVAIGTRGRLAATFDGGLSWTHLSVPTTEDLADASFAEAGRGWALDAAGSLFKTQDGGQTWFAVDYGGVAPAQAVVALGTDRVLLIGPRGIRRSANGGETFVPVQRRAVRRATLFEVDHPGGSLFAYGPTALFASRDGGKRWRKLRRPDHRPLGVVDFVDSRTGFALGKGGRPWVTHNRARTWKEVLAQGTDGGIGLAFSNAREGYLLTRDLFFARRTGRPDYVLRTSDGGASWRRQLVADSRSMTSLIATRESSDLLLAGRDELFMTTSGGDSGRRSRLALAGPRRRFAHPVTARIRGRLSPAEGGEQVIVSKTALDPRARRGGNDWSFKSVRAAADGRFEIRWRVRETSVFVAQWAGDGARTGAGSKVVKVRVARR